MGHYIAKIREKLLCIPADPSRVSRGYALGVFLGTTPFIGMKVVIALALTSLLRWSRVASVVGVYHINILTAPLFYSLSFLVGKAVTGSHLQGTLPHTWDARAVFSLFLGNTPAFMSLLAGGVILGTPMAFAAYFLSMKLLRRNYPLNKNNFNETI